MDWENQFQRWLKAEAENPFDDRPARLIIIETRKGARNGDPLDVSSGWTWVSEALENRDQQTFIHAVFQKQAAPKHLASLFLHRGVREENPSSNRLFIEPAVKALGATRVI